MLGELFQNRWQTVQSDMMADGQTQSAGNISGEVADGLLCVCNLPQDTGGSGKECFPRLGQGD